MSDNSGSDAVQVSSEEVTARVAGELTSDDILQFCSERGVPGKCPSCGKNDWTVLSPVPHGETALKFRRAPPDPGSSLPAVAFVCNNCYFIRQHATFGIARWKLAKSTKP